MKDEKRNIVSVIEQEHNHLTNIFLKILIYVLSFMVCHWGANFTATLLLLVLFIWNIAFPILTPAIKIIPNKTVILNLLLNNNKSAMYKKTS